MRGRTCVKVRALEAARPRRTSAGQPLSLARRRKASSQARESTTEQVTVPSIVKNAYIRQRAASNARLLVIVVDLLRDRFVVGEIGSSRPAAESVKRRVLRSGSTEGSVGSRCVRRRGDRALIPRRRSDQGRRRRRSPLPRRYQRVSLVILADGRLCRSRWRRKVPRIERRRVAA